MAFSPSGGLLATANVAARTVSVFSVGSGGALTPVAGSPFATGSFPVSVAFSATGGLLATANEGGNTVSVFSVGSGGALTAVAGSPFATGSEPASVAFSASGGLLATANEGGNTVSVFSVGSGGALTAVAGSPFATGSNPISVAFSPSGGLLATANSNANSVSVYADSDLALTGVPANITTNATAPTGAVVHYTPPTATDEDSAETPTVGCLPASGSLFAIGTTTVTCTATDSDDSNSPVSASFTVTVKGALAQQQDLLAYVRAIPASLGRLILVRDLNGMINNLQLGNTAQVCSDLTLVGLVAQEWSGSLISAAQADTILADVNRIGAVLGCNAGSG